MHPVLKRIAVNGLLSAIILGLIGMAFAELASIWLAGSPVRPPAGDPVAGRSTTDPLVGALRVRIPVMMASWGFLFVAISEGVLYLWRGGRTTANPDKSATPLKPDTAEVLLDDILRQIEASQGKPAAEALPPPGLTESALSESAPSPSPVAAQNSPSPELVPGERGA